MRQGLIAIIVAVALAAPVHAQVDCADWNTAAFFEAAEISDVMRCLQAGADPNVLPLAALSGNAGAVKVLLEAGADLEARAEGGNTPLHMAALGETAETVTALLEAGVVLSEYRSKSPDSKATGSYRTAQEGTQRR